VWERKRGGKREGGRERGQEGERESSGVDTAWRQATCEEVEWSLSLSLSLSAGRWSGAARTSTVFFFSIDLDTCPGRTFTPVSKTIISLQTVV